MNYLVLVLATLVFISCGRDKSQDIQISAGNIANGEKLGPRHPLEKSIVTIREENYGSSTFKCTGTILTQNSILAAAHCFPRTKYKVIINGKTYDLKQRIVYPGYRTDINLDIAIGKLATDIDPDDFHPVTLDSNESVPKVLRVIGRSRHITSPYDNYVSAILLQIPKAIKYKKLRADVYKYIESLPWSKKETVFNDKYESYTSKIYRSQSLNKINSPNLFFNNLGGGPLPGDSGGPVFVENKNGSFQQRGITQFVRQNYEYENFLNYVDGYHVHDSTCYANISYYIPWLEKMAIDHDLGEIKIAKSDEHNLSLCEQAKFNLNQLFIEKLGINLLGSTVNNNCAQLDSKIAERTEAAIIRCQKHCGKTDSLCKFSRDSMKTYKDFRKVLCSE